MEANEEETDSIDFLFKKFDGDKTLTTKHWISLEFQAFNKCVFKTSVDSRRGFCGTQVPYDKLFIWNFNKEKEEIVLYKKLIEINTNQELKTREVMRLKVLYPNENLFLLDLVSWE